MDFSEPPLSDLVDRLQQQVLPILLVVIVAVLAIWAAGLFVHGVVKALMDREASEGTAQELSAVELKKRMDTLDALATNAIRSFIVVVAGHDDEGSDEIGRAHV